MSNLKYLLALSQISGLGPIGLKKLIDHFGNCEKIYAASFNELMEVGLNQNVVQNIVSERNHFNPDEELAKVEKYQVKCLTYLDKNYPKPLKEIYSFPPLIYYKGKLIDFDKPMIAVVGTRRPTSEGVRITENLVRELVRSKITIVSGMAFGIDTVAHKTALENGGTTIAVLACGLDRIYPNSNYHLAKEIEKQGMIISEFPIGTLPIKENFPRRNRLISGLSLGTLVTEAPEKSGALITAAYALEQNREVFAIPYYPEHKLGQGCNFLIQKGAKLVTKVEDILEELGLNYFKLPQKEITFDNKIEELIYSKLLQGNKHVEQLIKETNLTSQTLNSTLTLMEVRGLIKRSEGGFYKTC